MSKDNLNTSVNDRTVYVSAVNVADLPEAVAKEFLRVGYTRLIAVPVRD
ncbi:MAG: hypothetical protein CM15mP54_18350 [Paracoccaceae bacterium]|nr:MAG: hypothetical protein CM15mP54_18350 [Paracoccaceae bacterium]